MKPPWHHPLVCGLLFWRPDFGIMAYAILVFGATSDHIWTGGWRIHIAMPLSYLENPSTRCASDLWIWLLFATNGIPLLVMRKNAGLRHLGTGFTFQTRKLWAAAELSDYSVFYQCDWVIWAIVNMNILITAALNLGTTEATAVNCLSGSFIQYQQLGALTWCVCGGSLLPNMITIIIIWPGSIFSPCPALVIMALSFIFLVLPQKSVGCHCPQQLWALFIF